jgi:RNA polymerase sigma-70 factor (ECF subfamily)
MWSEYVRRCAQGDQAALSALYDESSALIYGVIIGILRVPADAEEVALDVYSQVWRSAAVYTTQRGSVVSWLVTLARSRAIDRLRSRHTRDRKEEPLDDGTRESARQFATFDLNPEQNALRGQQSARVRQALAELPAEQRQALELAFFSGLSHSELADYLGQPLGTIKTRIRTGMMRLRELMGPLESISLGSGA